MRATVTSPKMLARPRSWPYSTLPRSWPSASTTSSRRSSRIARRSKLSCNSCRSSANPSVCSRCSNSACVIPAAWSPDSQSTNLSNRVNEAVKTPSTVSDAYACTRLLLCQRSGVGTHEPNGKEPLSITTRPPRRRSTPSTAHLQTSRTRSISPRAGHVSGHQLGRGLRAELHIGHVSPAGKLARPPHPPPDVQGQRGDKHRPHDERVDENPQRHGEPQLGDEHQWQCGEYGECGGAHQARGRDDATGDGQAGECATPGAQPQRLFPYPGHQEDVVVDAQRHQEHEHVEREG